MHKHENRGRKSEKKERLCAINIVFTCIDNPGILIFYKYLRSSATKTND